MYRGRNGIIKSFLGPFYLSLAAAIWGGLYVISKFTFDTIPPMTLLFIRYAMASVVLWLICFYKGIPLYLKEKRSLLIQVGFVGYFVSIAAQFVGTNLTSAHMGSLITTLSPLFLSLFAIFLLKEKMNKTQVVSMILATIGIFVIIGVPGAGGYGDQGLGIFILIIASITWGYYSVISRKASRYYSPLQITTVGIMLATIFSFPPIFVEINQWHFSDLFSMPIILSVLYVGIISTALALFSWNKGLQLTPAHQAGLFFFLQPVVGSFFGWLFLKEQLTATFFIGSLFIFIGVYLSMNQKAPKVSFKNKEKAAVEGPIAK
ncbi:EamA family transporter [Anaerobacillus arseniciselenatis]|uniref:EamA family transporter n=1 Tax=Anaerobacillus arseniciselenatis TaxID=85682 RepID=A0A1S2LBY0_9BACI|nr:EamA family transporter [Anaerobacillus arseniciselenatis]